MPRTVKIVSSYAKYGQISLSSLDHEAVASWQGRNRITCYVRPHPPCIRWCLAHPFVPLPRLIYTQFLAEGETVGKGIVACAKLLWSFGVLALVYTLIQPVFPTLSIAVLPMTLLVAVGGDWCGKPKTAPWHAAEHMAVNAYRRRAAISRYEFYEHERIDFDCGTTTGVLSAVAMLLGGFVAYWYRWPVLIVQIATLEVVLWLETFFSLAKIPGIRQLSAWVQTNVITSQPNELELRTAETALRALVETTARPTNPFVN